MLTKHEDKALKGFTPAMRRSLERRTAEFDLTADELDAIGVQVALAADAAAKAPWRKDIGKLMAPTEAESKAIEDAQAVYDKIVGERTALQLAAMRAEAAMATARNEEDYRRLAVDLQKAADALGAFPADRLAEPERLLSKARTAYRLAANARKALYIKAM